LRYLVNNNTQWKPMYSFGTELRQTGTFFYQI